MSGYIPILLGTQSYRNMIKCWKKNQQMKILRMIKGRTFETEQVQILKTVERCIVLAWTLSKIWILAIRTLSSSKRRLVKMRPIIHLHRNKVLKDLSSCKRTLRYSKVTHLDALLSLMVENQRKTN